MTAELLTKFAQKDRLSLARVISKIENRDKDLATINPALYARAGKSKVWGVTGPPGAGKSTLVNQLIDVLRGEGKTVAVIAVDPSSPFSGGAILGDRIRMQKHHADEGVYIRSLGTRGWHGGLSQATREVVMACDAFGFDVVIVETAGVGQTELEVLTLVQTVIVVLVPESGDGIQVMKAGLMEIADVFVINKSDRPEADKLMNEINISLTLSSHTQDRKIPVLKTEASRGVGVREVVVEAFAHGVYLDSSPRGASKIELMIRSEAEDLAVEQVRNKLLDYWGSEIGKKNLKSLLERKIDPFGWAQEWMAKVKFN